MSSLPNMIGVDLFVAVLYSILGAETTKKLYSSLTGIVITRLWSDQELGLDQDSPNLFQIEQSLENPDTVPKRNVLS